MKKIQSVLPELMVLGTQEVTVFTEGISIGAAFDGWGKACPSDKEVTSKLGAVGEGHFRQLELQDQRGQECLLHELRIESSVSGGTRTGEAAARGQGWTEASMLGVS